MKVRRMKRGGLVVAMLLGPVAVGAAENEALLPAVQVRGSQDAPFVESAGQQPRTETSIGRLGIANAARAGQSSIFQVLDLAPAVSLESLDAYGVARTAPGGGNMRIRGQSSSNLSLSVEGIPLAPPPRFGPREAAFDAENFAVIRLFKGASPTEFGNGWGSSAGSVDVSLVEPAAERTFQFRQGLGDDSFRRTFVRADTGTLNSGTRAAVSYSNTSTDKWRGTGEAPAQRENIFLDVAHRLDSGGRLRVFVNHNDYAGNLYRPLSYTQASDLGRFRDFDFNSTLSGVPASDVNYYGYNRIDERFTLVGGLIDLPLGNGELRLKPYYAKELIHNWDGMANLNGSPGIRDWRSDKTLFGITGEYAWKLPGGEIAAGYWGESYEWPAKVGKVYRPNSALGLTYAGWESLHKYDGDFVSHSPYVRFEIASDAWSFSGGIKHLTWKQPATLNYHLDSTLPDVAHESILSSGARLDSESSVGAHTDRAWLPNFGVSLAATRDLVLYANAGRNFNRNYFGGGEMARTFASSRPVFQAAGVTAEQLRNSEKLELADNLDIGARWLVGGVSLAPSLFYSRFQDKAVRVLDPVANVVYKQAAAKARALGVELEATWQASRSTQFFAGVTLNRSTFDNDIPLATGGRVAAKDRQFPDTPKRMAKLGMSSHFGPVEFAPLVKWVGERYGDVTNTQRVPGYAVVDATLRYTGSLDGIGKYDLALTVVNLFDRRYISAIAASDDGTANQATYYPGAPRTLALTFGATF